MFTHPHIDTDMHTIKNKILLNVKPFLIQRNTYYIVYLYSFITTDLKPWCPPHLQLDWICNQGKSENIFLHALRSMGAWLCTVH